MKSGTRISERQVIVFVAAMVLFGQVGFAKYSGGSGTAGNPYKIANAADLLALAGNTSDYDANFVLTADINLGASDPFTTAVIAPDTNNANTTFDGTAFTGIFDGNNHTISNLTIDTSGAGNDYLGLFGKIGSTGLVKNLGLVDVNIIGGADSIYLGGLAGWNASGATISNCYSTGKISGGTSAYHLGGLAGDNDGYISYCHSTVTINGGQNSQDLGGLVGFGGGTIIGSYSTSDVNGGNNAQYLGGLMGRDWGAGGTISQCYSTGSVKGGSASQYLGGLVGFDNSGSISNCYTTGDVNGGSGVSDLAGLIGYNYYAAVSYCYSTGDVNGGSGASNLGGLVAAANHGTVSHCYFLEGSGPDDGNGTPLTDAQMKKAGSFVGWDFAYKWQIFEGVSYPKLIWQSVYVSIIKCSVAAGSGSKGDSISFSGSMGATADDFNDANNSSDANFIEVTISDENSNNMDPCVIIFPVNGKTWKKGKFGYSGAENGVKKSFSYVVKTGKFTFSASNINLSGLECPVVIDIHVGNFAGWDEIGESIVNGKNPIPITLLMGVADSLRVDKSKLTRNKTTSRITQLTVSGGFSVGNLSDANMADNNSVVELAGQTFTIPKGNFKAGKNKFTCSKVNLYDGATLIGIATATFDFNKCIFTLTIKSTDFPAASGTTNFDIAFASFSGSDVVTLPP
jgi:hypothetical protein